MGRRQWGWSRETSNGEKSGSYHEQLWPKSHLEERGALCRSFIQLVIIRYRNIIFTSRTPQVKNRQNLTTLWGICSGVRGRLYASN